MRKLLRIVGLALANVRANPYANELTPFCCGSCGSLLTRGDIYWDCCGSCSLKPFLPEEVKAIQQKGD